MALILFSTVSSSSSSGSSPSAAAYGGGCLAALAGVGFVNDDRKRPVAVVVADVVEDEWELLDRRDYDFLPACDGVPEIPGALSVSDGGADLGELFDGVPDLTVEDHRSVTTMIESNTLTPAFWRPISWCDNHAIELDLPLPAECWTR